MNRTSSVTGQGSQSLHGVPPKTRASTAASKIAAQRRMTWLYIPALVFMLVMTQVPFVLAVWFSLHSWNLLQPALGFPFVGLANYINEFVTDPSFWPVTRIVPSKGLHIGNRHHDRSGDSGDVCTATLGSRLDWWRGEVSSSK